LRKSSDCYPPPPPPPRPKPPPTPKKDCEKKRGPQKKGNRLVVFWEEVVLKQHEGSVQVGKLMRGDSLISVSRLS